MAGDCPLVQTSQRQKVLSEAARKPGGRINALTGMFEEEDEPPAATQTAATPATASDSPPSWLPELIAAISNSAGRPNNRNTSTSSPSPTATPKPKSKATAKLKFDGCWHCGQKGHSRRECKAFQALMAKHNTVNPDRSTWKLPPGDTGKYEEAKKKATAALKKSWRVNMLNDSDGDEPITEDEWEDSDYDIMGPFLGQQTPSTSQSCRALRGQPTSTSNSFDDLSPCGLVDDSDTDDDLMCGKCNEEEEGGNDLEVDAANVDAVRLQEDLHSILNNFAYKTFIQVKGKTKKRNQSIMVQSPQQLQRLLTSGSKISQIARPSDKHKKSSSTPKVDFQPGEVPVFVETGSTVNAADIPVHFQAYASRIIQSRGETLGRDCDHRRRPSSPQFGPLQNRGRC